MTSPETFLPGAQRSLASRTSEAIGRNPDRRTGTVLSIEGGELVVQVAGGQVARAGYLADYMPSVGDVVALVLQRSTWLCLGRLKDPLATGVVPNHNGVRVQMVSAPSTNVAPFINMPGVEFEFTKRSPDTRLFAQMTLSCFTLTVATSGEFAFNINGVDTPLANFFFNTAGVHHTVAGFNYASGIPAGVYIVNGRMRRSGGGGTIFLNADDYVSLMCEEVP